MMTLEDDVVALVPMSTAHYQDYLQISLECPDCWAHSPNAPLGDGQMKTYMTNAIAGGKARTQLPYTIVEKAHNKICGSTRFYNIDYYNKKLFIGYTWLHGNMRGTGINKHCKYLLLNYAFNVMEIERVEFHADILNQRSIAAMKSIGALFEGVLRSDVIMPSGRRRDSAVLSILRDEWFACKKAALAAKL